MRYETAIRRLRTISARCQQAAGLWEDEPFLIGVYAFGAVLDAPPTWRWCRWPSSSTLSVPRMSSALLPGLQAREEV